MEKIDPNTGEVKDFKEETPIGNRRPDDRRIRVRNYFQDEFGREIPDPRPVAPPVGYKKQPSMVEIIRGQVAAAMVLHAADRGIETLEESEDFDVGDDYDPHSPWENDFDPPFSEVRKAVEEARAKKAATPPATPESPPAPPPPSPSGDVDA